MVQGAEFGCEQWAREQNIFMCYGWSPALIVWASPKMMMIKSNIVFSHISTTLDHTIEFSRFPYFVTDICNNIIIIGYALRARDQNLV
jgi:hypothetical protein